MERRRLPRIERALVTYYRPLHDDAVERAALTVNVSGSGVLVELDEPVDVGTSLAIEVVLPGESVPVNFTSRVVRKDEAAMAMQILEIAPADRARLEEYLMARYGQGIS